MKHRTIFLLLGTLMGGAGAFASACSSTSGGGTMTPEAGADSTVEGGRGDSSSFSDTGVFGGDTGLDGGQGSDGPLANCSPIKGTCDIVSQNCGSGMECIAGLGPDGGEVTACAPTQGSEHLPRGHACCPSGTNPCDPGLECIGNTCSLDAAAPQTGRCSPHCCFGPDGGDDTPCGQSDPEGYPGHCDLNIVDNNNNPLYTVCTYSPNCKPLHVQPCQPGYACEVTDPSGTATCSQIFNPSGADGGATEGQPCLFANECADGLMCLTSASSDSGSACFLLCYVPGQTTPFDAGLVNSGGPGYGGCPANENCGSAPNLFPAWLGVCE